MLLRLAALEGLEVEGLRRPAPLPLDQRLTDGLKLKPPLLLAPDEVPDGLTVIGVMTGGHLRGDPGVLLLGQGDRLADSGHVTSSFGADHHTVGAVWRIVSGSSAGSPPVWNP
jgi:hypothetical protein